MNDINKLSLPATILIASIILGGFYYAVERNKQASIEKQQQTEQEAKLEQDTKEYAAKQKTACLDIYTTEGKKWNNVSGWDYSADTDKCEITYKDAKKKTQEQCDKALADLKAIYKDAPLSPYAISSYIHCIDGTFSKEF